MKTNPADFKAYPTVNFRIAEIWEYSRDVVVDFYIGNTYGFTDILNPAGFHNLLESGILDLSEA